MKPVPFFSIPSANSHLRSIYAAFVLSASGMLAAQAQIEIMPLGDSITAGGGVGNDGTDASGYCLQSGYRSQLYSDLVADNINFQFQGTTTYHETAVLAAAGQAYNNGFGGYTLNDIYQNLAGSDNGNAGYWLTGGGGTGRSAVFPNIVLLMGGTNDLDDGLSASTMETSMSNILGWFQTNRPNTEVIVSTVLPFLQPNGYLSPSATASADNTAAVFNTWLETTEVPAYSNTQLINMNALFTANESIYFSVDGAHPNSVGYDAMGDAWASAIEADVVPEPSSSWLFMVGMVPLMLWYYRRGHRVHHS